MEDKAMLPVPAEIVWYNVNDYSAASSGVSTQYQTRNQTEAPTRRTSLGGSSSNSYKETEEKVHHCIEKKKRKQKLAFDHDALVKKEMEETMGSHSMPEDSLPQRFPAHRRGLHAFDLAMNPDAEASLRAGGRYAEAHHRPQTPARVDSEGSSSDACLPELLPNEGPRFQNSFTSAATSDTFDSTSTRVRNAKRPRSSCGGHRMYNRRLTFPKIKERVKNKATLEGESPDYGPWLEERLSTSCRPCRFELPFDMLKLKKMSAQEYLLSYCRIPADRQRFYHTLFNKYIKLAKKETVHLSFKEMDKVLRFVLVTPMDATDLAKLYCLLNLHPGTMVDRKLFTVVCAVAERILYVTIVGRQGEVGVGGPGFLESADFYALEWKLRHIHIDPKLRKLLFSLG